MTAFFEGSKVSIRHSSGKTVEGIILTQRDQTIRVAVKGYADAVVLTCANGTWISDECEAVVIESGRQQYSHNENVSLSDCICPKELATQLIRRLLGGDDEEPLEPPAASAEGHPAIERTGPAASPFVN